MVWIAFTFGFCPQRKCCHPLTPALEELFELYPICANCFFYAKQLGWHEYLRVGVLYRAFFFLLAHMAVVQMVSFPSRSILLPSSFPSIVLFVFRLGAVLIFVFLVTLAGGAAWSKAAFSSWSGWDSLCLFRALNMMWEEDTIDLLSRGIHFYFYWQVFQRRAGSDAVLRLLSHNRTS